MRDRPDNLPPKAIQRLFREHLLEPTAKPCLPNLHNFMGVSIDTNRMIIAYHCPNNLRNLFFPRIFQQLDNTPVSTFLLCTLAAAAPAL